MRSDQQFRAWDAPRDHEAQPPAFQMLKAGEQTRVTRAQDTQSHSSCVRNPSLSDPSAGIQLRVVSVIPISSHRTDFAPCPRES